MPPHVKVTPELRQRIVKLKTSGMTLSAISRELGRSKSVISRVLKLYNENKTFKSPATVGRPRITTVREDRGMKRYVTKDPFETAAGISRQIKANSNKEVSRFTVSRRLNEFGLRARSPASKPIISKKNQKARREYAEAHVIWRDEDWERIHFSDESKFNLVGSDGRQFVRRAAGDRLNPKCVKKTAKHGGGSVMVWGMFSSEGVGPLVRIIGTVNANVYLNLVQQHVIPPLRASPNQPAIFMQDNAPCHTAKRVKDYFEQEDVEVMKWPAQSPDLNPIENLWKIIGDKVRERQPSTVTDLWTKIEQEWNKITPEFCKKLVRSCGRRCAEVIKNKGFNTSY